MILGETFRDTGPPPAGMVPLAGGTIIVETPPEPSKPPIKNPVKPAPVFETPKIESEDVVEKPKPLPISPGGPAAVTAQIIAADAPISIAPPESVTIKMVEPEPDEPQPELSLRHPPPAEPLTQRTRSQLNREELIVVRELAARDRDVRAHEQAHVAAAAGLAGSPSYTFVTGPDAQRYAVSGEVKIDSTKAHGDPEATIIKMEQVKRAALAPSQPSGQDKSVAGAAEANIRNAEAELHVRDQEEEENRIIEDAVKKEAEEKGEPVITATLKQATQAFAKVASFATPRPIFLEGIIA